jgi:hypothetical protein
MLGSLRWPFEDAPGERRCGMLLHSGAGQREANAM